MKNVALATAAAFIAMAPHACAEYLFLRGRVTMVDGTPPGKTVGIERDCVGAGAKVVAITSKTGAYLWRAEGDLAGGLDLLKGSDTHGLTGSRLNAGSTVFAGFGIGGCILRASLTGYQSSRIDLLDKSLFREPQLPVLVLTPGRTDTDLQIKRDMVVPGQASKQWAAAEKAIASENWPEAVRQLTEATGAAPKFRLGWLALGLAYHNLKRPREARDAYRKGAELDPRDLAGLALLARANLDCEDWAEASRTATALLAADTRRRFLDVFLHDAVARYHLNDLTEAKARLQELLDRDKAHRIPRAEYVMGIILEAQGNLDLARVHMNRYLELQPNAADKAAVRARIENLGKTAASEEIDAPNPVAATPGETTVPGGLKAFAAIAHIEEAPTYDNFFVEYCRQLVRDAAPNAGDRIPSFSDQLVAYMTAVTGLEAAGEKRPDDSVVVTLAMTSPEDRQRTARLVRLLGWTLDDSDALPRIVLGDQPVDGLRQPIAAALGIDEIAMRNALEAGRNFSFDIRSESARLTGGIAWAAALKGLPAFPGGMAEVFARDQRFAKAYAGLGSMNPDIAMDLIRAVGIRELVTRCSDILALGSGSFTSSTGRADAPGGQEALPVWTKLAGADPAKPVEFFRALLGKDQGRLAAFYLALAQADEKHQRYFTAGVERARRFYEWYRDSAATIVMGSLTSGSWRAEILARLPLDDSGKVRFPGGRAAWSASSGADEEVLPRLEALEALAPVASLEEKRGAPLDETSARLLADHYTEWRHLFPYFENLPALGSGEWEALARFADSAGNRSLAARNIQVGEWHSLVKLIELGVKAGSLDPRAAARAFGRVCLALSEPDPSANALEVLREVAGGQGSLDEAVATRLLRLNGPRREAFDRVREFQSAPSLDAALAAHTAAATLAALSGTVYAAVLDPDTLLTSEDPKALSRHRFVPAADPKDKTIFFPTFLVRTAKHSPSHLTGGFMTFEEVAGGLARHKVPAQIPGAARPAKAGSRAPAKAAAAPPAGAVFRVSGRLVEVLATVTDGRGAYVDNLPATQFTVLEDGKPVPLLAFEDRSTPVSVALLFDSTGSMQNALPALKSAALRLIQEMRPIDALAVYSFNAAVSELQPFTTDKEAAERAVLRTRAFGGTALYDALVRVNRDLTTRAGKKAIVVFTDGDDNLSTLNAGIAIERAKAAGAPIYTIAQGAALSHTEFLEMLAGVSNSTGGMPFVIKEPAEILKVFESVSRDLTHGYLLTFQPRAGEAGGWHTIKVTLPVRGRTVRAREGYSVD